MQLLAQELVVRVREVFLQMLGHPKALLALGAEDRLHCLVGSEPLPVLLVLISREKCILVTGKKSYIFKTEELQCYLKILLLQVSPQLLHNLGPRDLKRKKEYRLAHPSQQLICRLQILC